MNVRVSRMEVVLLVYNIVLIVIFAVAGALSFILYRKKKSSVFLALTFLFIVNILDNTIIYMTEIIEWFSVVYDNQFMTLPSVKTVIILCYSACIVCITTFVLKEKIKPFHIAGLAALALATMFIPMLPNSAVKVWLYYLPSQILQILLCVYGFTILKRKKELADRPHIKLFRKILKVTLVFAFLILAEDSLVIFNIDIYSDLMIRINNRNYCEDLLSMIYSVTVIRFCFQNLTVEAEHPAAEIPQAAPVVTEPEMVPQDTPKLKKDFCAEYSLTSRESEILELLLQDNHNQEICEILHISIGTVKTHVHNIYNKVGVKKRLQLIQVYECYPEPCDIFPRYLD